MGRAIPPHTSSPSSLPRHLWCSSSDEAAVRSTGSFSRVSGRRTLVSLFLAIGLGRGGKEWSPPAQAKVAVPQGTEVTS